MQPLDVKTVDKPTLVRLWERVHEADYAFDDYTRDRADLWLSSLLNGEYYYGEEGMVWLNAITPVNANIHFITFDHAHVRRIVAIGRDVIRHAFEDIGVTRMTAYIPEFNHEAQRLSTLLGFNHEGILRQYFLYHGVLKDVRIHGLLKWEWAKREAEWHKPQPH